MDKRLASLTTGFIHDSEYDEFDNTLIKIEIDLNEDLYNTALNFYKIQDSVIKNIFIETIKNLMNESYSS